MRKENTILLSASEESDETIKPVSSIVSPTVSHAHTDVSEEVSKSEILKEVILKHLKVESLQ